MILATFHEGGKIDIVEMEHEDLEDLTVDEKTHALALDEAVARNLAISLNTYFALKELDSKKTDPESPEPGRKVA